MTGQTPIYGLPYLTGSDGGRHVPQVSRDLALQLEAILASTGQTPLDSDLQSLLQRLAALESSVEESDTGWIQAALAAGWSEYPGETFSFRVMNGICYLAGRASGTAAADTLMFTLPTFARHALPYDQAIYNTHSDNGSTIISVKRSGEVHIFSRAGQSRSGVSLSGIAFPVG